MEINNSVVQGQYEDCYSSIIQNVRSQEEQCQLIDFIELTRTRCCEVLTYNLTKLEKQIENQYCTQIARNSSSSHSSDESKLEKQLIHALTTFNVELQKMLSASIVFGSVMYSLGDFRLKQEKSKFQSLQHQCETYHAKYDKLRRETKCFTNMCKTKDDFILKLKDKVISLQQQQEEDTTNNSKTPSPNSLLDSAPKSYGISVDASDSSASSDMYTYSFGKFMAAQQNIEMLEESIIEEEIEREPKAGFFIGSERKQSCKEGLDISMIARNRENNSNSNSKHDMKVISFFDAEFKEEKLKMLNKEQSAQPYSHAGSDQGAYNLSNSLNSSQGNCSKALSSLVEESSAIPTEKQQKQPSKIIALRNQLSSTFSQQAFQSIEIPNKVDGKVITTPAHHHHFRAGSATVILPEKSPKTLRLTASNNSLQIQNPTFLGGQNSIQKQSQQQQQQQQQKQQGYQPKNNSKVASLNNSEIGGSLAASAAATDGYSPKRFLIHKMGPKINLSPSPSPILFNKSSL